MISDLVQLGPSSPFSQEVFRRIRPHIPRERWPTDRLSIAFTADPSGLFLRAWIEPGDFPHSYADVAVRAVAQAGVDLVVVSPFARIAKAVVAAKRWRDTFLYMGLPLLFAIPLMGSLAQRLMMLCGVLFLTDLGALVMAQVTLSRRRSMIANARVVAEIPLPGSVVHVGGPVGGGPVGG